jgi:hypothetical protein
MCLPHSKTIVSYPLGISSRTLLDIKIQDRGLAVNVDVYKVDVLSKPFIAGHRG